MSKKITVRQCVGFKYKDRIFKSFTEAKEAYQREAIEAAFPYKSPSILGDYSGYSAREIFEKWDCLVRIMQTEVTIGEGDEA